MLFKINEIKAIKLISKPNHEEIHELDEIVIIVPVININKNIIFEIFLIIKKKRFLYKWGMNSLALV